MSFIDQLEKDTGLARQEFPVIMSDKGEWRKLVELVRVHPK